MEENQHQVIEKNLSVASVSSDALDLEDSVVQEVDCDEAPYDIMGEHELMGQVVVARKGVKLPLITSWKISEGCPVALKFEVSRKLEVTINFASDCS